MIGKAFLNWPGEAKRFWSSPMKIAEKIKSPTKKTLIKKCHVCGFIMESESEIKKLIEISVKHNICLVPYGGGTSVSSALKIPKEEQRMIVSVDTRRLNNILKFDKDNLLIKNLLAAHVLNIFEVKSPNSFK